MRRGGGFSGPLSPSVEFCKIRGPVWRLSTGKPANDTSVFRTVRLERALLSRGRPLLHETLLPGSRNALRTTAHAETQKIAMWRPRPGDPPHDEPFQATRQHSTTRGEAPFQQGNLKRSAASLRSSARAMKKRVPTEVMQLFEQRRKSFPESRDEVESLNSQKHGATVGLVRVSLCVLSKKQQPRSNMVGFEDVLQRKQAGNLQLPCGPDPDSLALEALGGGDVRRGGGGFKKPILPFRAVCATFCGTRDPLATSDVSPDFREPHGFKAGIDLLQSHDLSVWGRPEVWPVLCVGDALSFAP